MSNARNLSVVPNQSLSFKNRIINGAMQIDQRNAGSSVVSVSGGNWTVDRWFGNASQGSKGSFTQSSANVSITGQTKSVGFISSSAYSVSATDFFNIQQPIEGLNVADFAWGTASAKSATLSFWVFASAPGTYGGSVRNNDNSRSYPFSYSVSSGGAWEYKTITIPGDTSGVWATDNTAGIKVGFGLGVGSTFSGTAGSWASANYFSATGATSVVGTNGAYLYFTGVQLEKGSTATSFDYRPYGTELVLCQRYYQQWGGEAAYERLVGAYNYSTTQARADVQLNPNMRAAPSVTYSAVGNWGVESNGAVVACNAITADQMTTKVAGLLFGVASGLTAGYGCHITANNTTSARLGLNSEL